MEAAMKERTDPRAALPRGGLENFWYPLAASRRIGDKPKATRLLGQEVVFYRDAGRVVAMHNRCPHRGMPLVAGKRHFPGTISCAYHGWTFNSKGDCVAALNEGPASRLPGRVKVRIYPVEERNGLAWIFMGRGTPTVLEDDVPTELTDDRQVLFFQTEVWNTNWLPAMENLMDTHDLFVHRGSLFYMFLKLPAWAKVRAETMSDGKGVSYGYEAVGPLQDTYPGLGRWPRRVWWRRSAVPSPNKGEYFTAELKLPCVVRVGFSSMMFTRYMVPIDDNQVRAFVFSSRRAEGFRKLLFILRYRLWASWSLMKFFIRQDVDVFEQQDYRAPERLSITDVGLAQWRRVVAAQAQREHDGSRQPGAARPARDRIDPVIEEHAA